MQKIICTGNALSVDMDHFQRTKVWAKVNAVFFVCVLYKHRWNLYIWKKLYPILLDYVISSNYGDDNKMYINLLADGILLKKIYGLSYMKLNIK